MVSQIGIPYQADPERPDYANERVFRRGCLPARSYHIPETSVILNGDWDFCYAATPEEAPQPNNTNIDDSTLWQSIEVPGHWQLQGHGRPQYTNTQFPFPVNPPHVPTENPTGSYRRTFRVPRDWDPKAALRLRFDGVDSAYHLWLNGFLLGYAQGSRNPSEFDISSHVLRDESNELWVSVYQWSDGSYIEDQDQWWLSGIFRDVYLIAFPTKCCIEDYNILPYLDEKYDFGGISVRLDVRAAQTATLTLTLKECPENRGTVITSKTFSISPELSYLDLDLSVTHKEIQKLEKWTAETPYLYEFEMKISTDDNSAPQVVHQRVGFRKIEMRNGLLTVNGTPLLLHGVNRHDHHPTRGRAVPVEFLRRDLLQMKAHNINAVRCSHYPSHPALLDICDELGLWVIDEADLECHGFYDAVARPLDIPEDMDYEERKKFTFSRAALYTSDNPNWKDAYVDRMTQLVQRDKNHPSVIIWSLGNEAFYGQNHRAMYDYAKRVDPTRPIHYEGDPKAETADMFSYMYPSIVRLTQLVTEEGVEKDGTYTKPVVLCEYAHAMGNGPGGLEDYEQLFRQYPRLQGGFIWEWANHGVWKQDGSGPSYYAYGGDFGDWPNDGTFVMDGLCYSDHTPSPGLIELKKVIQPVHTSIQDDQIFVENRYSFLDLTHVQAKYQVESIGKSARLLAKGELKVSGILPGENASFPLPKWQEESKSDSEVWLTVSFYLRAATEWADAGHEVAWFQHCLGPSKSTLSITHPAAPQSSCPHITSKPTAIVVSHNDWSFTFDRVRGYLTSWTVGSTRILDPRVQAALTLGIWRPPTDNDRPSSLPYWQRFGVQAMTSDLISISQVTDPSNTSLVVIKLTTFLAPQVLDWGLTIETTYTISSVGSLEIHANVMPSGSMPTHVPRIGLDLRLNSDFQEVSWFGLGPGEAYPDKRAAQRIGIWNVPSIAELETRYDVPQEGGNRMNTRWLTLAPTPSLASSSNKKRPYLRVTGTTPFSWRASRYGAETIETAKHPCDVQGKEEDAVLLRLDHAVAGVGTAACGPGPREDMLVKLEKGKSFDFSFLLDVVAG